MEIILKEYSLNGKWKLCPDKEDRGKELGYCLNEIDTSQWLSVDIPCHWEVAIPAFYKNNPEIVWCRKEFTLEEIGGPDELESKLIRVIFKGVFYYAEVYLNGQFLGSHEGYFEPFSFIINPYLQEKNILTIIVKCFDEQNRGNKKQVLGTFGHWDLSDPHANAGGIWNDVVITVSKKIAIERVRKITTLKNIKLAKENIYIKISALENIDTLIKISYIPKNFQGQSFQKEFSIIIQQGIQEYAFELEISNPELWWTYDYGSQNLYLMDVKCYIRESEQEEVILDKYQFQTGIKEFQLEQSGRNGEKWKIYFNKKQFFPKGTNYPPWQRLQTATKENFKKDLQLFKEANMNILRIHAHLSRPEFYEACNEEGILLWQDLPLQWTYHKKVFPEIKRQAKIAVETHQSHPAIGIWCAHNEPFFAPDMAIIKKSVIVFISTIGIAFFLGIVVKRCLSPSLRSSFLATLLGIMTGAGIIFLILWLAGKLYDLYPFGLFSNSNSAQLDPDLYLIIKQVEQGQNGVIPYSGICELPYLTIFRSPKFDPKIFGFHKCYTDFHYYAGWYNGSHRNDYRYHIKWWGLHGKLREKARFVTEYGVESFPILENFIKFHPAPSSWPPTSAWWKPLIEDRRFQKHILDKYVKPNQYISLADYITATQEWHAECVKATTEMFRQIKYRPLAGLITFLGMDCFPSISMGFIDSYRTPKKVYQVVKEIFEPLYVMVDWPKKEYKIGEVYQSTIYVSNDYWENIPNLEISYKLFTSKEVILENGIFNIPVDSDCVAEVGSITFQIPAEKYLILEFSWYDPKQNGKRLCNTYQFDIGMSRWKQNY
ncbi:MAG TPA: hypothetical protein VMV49_13635 [Candidatus Deferrimicrobium sp.]|nr:hypothetical protein [Candidatus Deferrimicrobium sp.]